MNSSPVYASELLLLLLFIMRLHTLSRGMNVWAWAHSKHIGDQDSATVESMWRRNDLRADADSSTI